MDLTPIRPGCGEIRGPCCCVVTAEASSGTEAARQSIGDVRCEDDVVEASAGVVWLDVEVSLGGAGVVGGVGGDERGAYIVLLWCLAREERWGGRG